MSAQNLQDDPRYKGIKEELKTNWEKSHGSKWKNVEGSSELRTEFQDYVFGNPTKIRRYGNTVEQIIPLEEDAKKTFAERYPEDAKSYLAKEISASQPGVRSKTKITATPKQTPTPAPAPTQPQIPNTPAPTPVPPVPTSPAPQPSNPPSVKSVNLSNRDFGVELKNLIHSNDANLNSHINELKRSYFQLSQSDPGNPALQKLSFKLNTAQGIQSLKNKNPRLSAFMKKIVDNPQAPQGKVGKIFGSLVSEGATAQLAWKKGFSYGGGWLAGKIADKGANFIARKTLVPIGLSGQDAKGNIYFRPTTAIRRKVYNVFHTQDSAGKFHFRPTHALSKTRIGQKVGKVFARFAKFSKLASRLITKFTGPIGLAITTITAAVSLAKKVLKYVGGAAAGLYIYMLLSGLLPVIIGATIGLVVGGTVGLVAGAWAGFTVGMTIAPFIATIPVFGVPLAIVTVAACTIAGAIIGSSIGAFIGTVIGGTIGYIAAGHFGGTATLAGAGVGAGVGFAVGGPVGAVVGAVIGGWAGSHVGQWLNAAWGAGSSAVGSFFSAVGQFFTGVGQGIWTGISWGASHFADLITGMGSLTPGTAIAFIPVGVIGAAATVSAFISIETGAGFFNPYDVGQGLQKSEFINVTKTANQDHFDNPPPTRAITFTVTIRAPKGELKNIHCEDKTIIHTESGSIPIDAPASFISECEAGSIADERTISFNFSVTEEYKDSLITNNILVSADIDGQSRQTSQAYASVTIGEPSVNFPSGWPITGGVTQGPNTCSDGSHCGLAAIDIGADAGTQVCATHDGFAEVWKEAVSNPPNPPGPYSCKTYGCLGNYILIKSADGSFTSIYGHLQDFAVNSGQEVKKGQLIGHADNTGTNTSGSHLHYEFWGLPMKNVNSSGQYIPVTIPDGFEWPSSYNSPYQTQSACR